MKFMRAEIKGEINRMKRMRDSIDSREREATLADMRGIKYSLGAIIKNLEDTLDDEKTRRQAKIKEDILEAEAESDRMNQEIVVER